ncbi:MAG: FAD-dependent oxidoreductase [bacterium]|nr:MAG: FAD-dependent oxidoreductase [bacterium]
MGRHLVLAGGGHAHLTTLLRTGEITSRGHQVTVVGPSPYHYYSGMAPGMVSGHYRPQQIRFHIRKMVVDRGGRFIEDRIEDIRPREKELVLASGITIPYDTVSFNIGSEVPTGRIVREGRNIFTVKPIENLLRGRLALEALHRDQPAGEEIAVCVVGGGPAGVELAGSVWALTQRLQRPSRITLLTGGKLLGRLPRRVRDLAFESLASRGVAIHEDVPVEEITAGSVKMEDGQAIDSLITFVAVGVKPSSLFRNTEVPAGDDGGLLVNNRLQSVDFPEIFGGGDCVTLEGDPLARVGVYAVRQNPVLFHNLLASLEGTPLTVFEPGSPSFLLILNMGDGTGILRKGKWIYQGRLAFRLKDWIDRRFMKRYQVSGELEEELGNIQRSPEFSSR